MIGEKLGKYTILETVGTGSMGTVYRAEDPELSRIVAVKRVRSNVLYDMSRRERFMQDVLAASLIRHKGICPILEIGDDQDDFFVVTPFLECRSLESYMDGKPLPWRKCLDIAIQVGEALAAVHRMGVVHRGIKPSNVFLQTDGSILLTDCCIGRFTEIEKRGRGRPPALHVGFADTLIPLSALSYMSPEQVRGDKADHRTDIFGFGALLYEMVTGRHPFESRSSLARMSAILEADPPPLSTRFHPLPEPLCAMVRKALAKSPRERYQTIAEMLEALAAIRDSLTGESRPAPARSRPAWLFGAVVAIAILFLLTTALLYWRAP